MRAACANVWIALLLQQPLAYSQVSWSFAGPSGSADRISAIAVDPRNEAVMYAATPGGGVWKTLDAGLTWSPISDPQGILQFCSLAIDPRTPDILYAGTGDDQSPRAPQGILRSPDGGRTWNELAGVTNRPVCALAIDPANSSRLFAGSEEGLFISADSGSTWTKALGAPVTSIAFDGLGIVYAATTGEDSPGARNHLLARSSDGGRTWTDLSVPRNVAAPTAAVTWVSVLTSGSRVLVAVLYQAATPNLDFFSSTDAGNSWIGAYGIGQARPPIALAIDPSSNLYLAASNLLTSSDGGSTWVMVTTKKTDFHSAAFSGGSLLLAGEKGLEAVTPAGGSRDVLPFPVTQVVGLAIDNANRIWAGGPSGLFSLLPSLAPTQIGIQGVGQVGRVAVAEAANGALSIFTAGTNQIYVSTDGGAQFSGQSVIAFDEARAAYPPLIIDPVVTSTAYAAGRRIYRTTNSGGGWTALGVIDPDPSRVVTALAMAPAARTTLFAATACLPEISPGSCPPVSFVWRSTNAGQTWVQMSIVAGYVNQFAIDPRQSTRVYAAVGAFPAGPSKPAGLIAGDLLVSTNAGAAWSSTLGNLAREPINSVVIDPSSLPALFTQPAQTVYVGTDSGVFVSFDAGIQWTNISNGLPASPVTSLALLQPDGILAAATFGRGVYRGSVTGIAPGLIARPLSLEVTLMQGTSSSAGVSLTNASSSTTVAWQLNAMDSWLTVPQPNGTIRPLGSAQIPAAVSAAGLSTGTYRGRLELSSPFGTQTVRVQAHVTPAPAQMTILGGNNATGLTETSLPPLEVQVLDATGSPLAGTPVTFTITTGGGSLSARIVLTDTSGIADVTLTLPPQPGTVQVTATSGPVSVVFTAKAIAAPVLLTDSIFNGVTFNANTSFGPGAILLIAGQNLATAEASAAGELPPSLAATRVLLATEAGDVTLPLFSVSPSRITAIMPFDIAPGRYLLYCEVGSIRSNGVEISVAAFDPGIFAINGGGRGPGIFLKDDGSIVSAANPADRGSRVTFYAAGLGPVSPAVAAGQPGAVAEPLNRTIQTPRVFFDRYTATVLYSGLAPGIAGRYQVTVQVPALVSPATNVSVSLTIGGFTSNRVTIPVR